MADAYHLIIVTPDGEILDREVKAIRAPGAMGQFGVLPGHAPLLSAIRPGILEVKAEQYQAWFAIGDGLIEVNRNGVVVLADAAIEASTEDEAKTKLSEVV